jgi:hypothetical protein
LLASAHGVVAISPPSLAENRCDGFALQSACQADNVLIYMDCLKTTGRSMHQNKALHAIAVQQFKAGRSNDLEPSV